MKIAVLFDEISPEDVLADKDVLQQVKIITETLTRLQHDYVLVPCTLDLLAFKDRITQEKPRLCFNLLDTLDSKDCLSHLPIAVLDACGIRHTGPDAIVLSNVTRKLVAKERLREHDLPTPNEITVDTDKQKGGKWIIKGSAADGSFAMSDNSVVEGTTRFVQRILRKRMKEEKSQLFAEQYIEGREFTVPFLGTGLLPIAEVTYQGYPDGKPKILAQSAKWSPDSFEYKHTGSRFEFTESDERLLTSLRYNSKQCIKLFHLCGWGRIDYRVDKDNNSYIIDINVGSFLAPDAWWAESVKFAGVEFDAAIQVIIEDSTK